MSKLLKQCLTTFAYGIIPSAIIITLGIAFYKYDFLVTYGIGTVFLLMLVGCVGLIFQTLLDTNEE